MSTNSKSLAYSRAKGTMEELKTVDTGILGYMEDVPFIGERIVEKLHASPLTSGDLFTNAGGFIRVKELFGLITTDIQAQATDVSLHFTSSRAGATKTALNVQASSELNGLTDGTMIRITGDFSEIMKLGPDGDGLIESDLVDANGILMEAGTISVVYENASTGAISWYCVYESLGGIITAS